jgi:CDP-glucose 4,6-dehydratase
MANMNAKDESINFQKYKGKRVLITGHTGFKGSWLCIWLLNLGAKVIGVSKDPYTKYDNFVMSKLSNKIVDLRGDVRNLNEMKEIFNRYKPEMVFHLAAQPLVRVSYDMPVETYDTNVMGSLNVLECIRESDSVGAGIIITSDKCYENTNQILGYRESDKLGGYDPYSSSKACVELIASAYINSFFNPKDYKKHGKLIATVRAGNVIGGGDWSKDRIFPDIVKAIENKAPIIIRNPEAVRPWQHVLEPIRGYLLLGEQMFCNNLGCIGAWNFGPDFNDCLTVQEIVSKTIKLFGEGSYIISENSGPHEAELLSIDCTKAKKCLEWNPLLSIDDALKLTVEWYKNYKSKDVFELCINQIKIIEKSSLN